MTGRRLTYFRYWLRYWSARHILTTPILLTMIAVLHSNSQRYGPNFTIMMFMIAFVILQLTVLGLAFLGWDAYRKPYAHRKEG